MSDNSFIPVYQRLYNYYEQAILSLKYKPGDQLDSINKIMLTHKVSRDTAKQVLSMLAEKGLIVKRVGKGSFVTHGSTTQNVVITSYSIHYTKLYEFNICSLGR